MQVPLYKFPGRDNCYAAVVLEISSSHERQLADLGRKLLLSGDVTKTLIHKRRNESSCQVIVVNSKGICSDCDNDDLRPRYGERATSVWVLFA